MPDNDEHPAVAIPQRAAKTGTLLELLDKVERALKQASQQRQRLNQRPVADTLFVYEPSSPDEAAAIQAFARIRYGVASPIDVSSWDEVVTELGKYRQTRRLVLFTHGVPGRVQIGNEFLTGAELAPRLSRTNLTVTESVTFEGCSTMRTPLPMASAASAVNAPAAIGYTWWHYLLFKRYTLAKDGKVSNKSAAKIRAWFKANGKYLVRPLRGGLAQVDNADEVIAELERQAASRDAAVSLYMEFMRDGPGPAAVARGDRPRRSATQITLAKQADVEKFTQLDLNDIPRVVTLRTRAVLAGG